MSATRSFSSNLRVLRGAALALALLTGADSIHAQGALPSAVSSQAHTDAEAQRRLQETAREAQRQRRIEEQIRRLAPALSAEKLASSAGPALARQGLAALVTLRREGVSSDEAFLRATRSAGTSSSAAAQPIAYLRNLLTEHADKITPSVLAKLAAGEDPGPALPLPAYKP